MAPPATIDPITERSRNVAGTQQECILNRYLRNGRKPIRTVRNRSHSQAAQYSTFGGASGAFVQQSTSEPSTVIICNSPISCNGAQTREHGIQQDSIHSWKTRENAIPTYISDMHFPKGFCMLFEQIKTSKNPMKNTIRSVRRLDLFACPRVSCSFIQQLTNLSGPTQRLRHRILRSPTCF